MTSDFSEHDSLNNSNHQEYKISRRNLLIISSKTVAGLTLAPLTKVMGSNIPGDLNDDRWVDEEDLKIFGSEWLSSATSSIANLDSAYSSIPGSASSVVSVDFQDYSVMAENWKNRCSASDCLPPVPGDITGDGRVEQPGPGTFLPGMAQQCRLSYS